MRTLLPDARGEVAELMRGEDALQREQPRRVESEPIAAQLRVAAAVAAAVTAVVAAVVTAVTAAAVPAPETAETTAAEMTVTAVTAFFTQPTSKCFLLTK